MTVEITEILGRAAQGVTEPFKCKGADGNLYYVKGVHATRASQINEWLCGHLACALDLPVPPFTIVQVPEELLDIAPLEWRCLGAGPAFGSQAHPYAIELPWQQVGRLPADLKRDVLLFDWWIKNGDRCFSRHGGNPNLLWAPAERGLIVIDHNQAFDDELTPPFFAENHVFRDSIDVTLSDMVFRGEFLQRLEAAFARFEWACDNIPDEWWWIDHGVRATYDLTATSRILARYLDASFWEIAR